MPYPGPRTKTHLSDFRVNQDLAPFSVLPSLGLKYAIEMEFHDLRVDCAHGALRIRGLSRARHFPASVERISSSHSSLGEDCSGDCCNRYLHFRVGESTEVAFLPLTGILILVPTLPVRALMNILWNTWIPHQPKMWRYTDDCIRAERNIV